MFPCTDYEPAEKRQLYAFPRVGRSDMSLLREPYAEVQVPAKRTDNPGMWFGPRLGRSFKSDEDGEHVSLFDKIDGSEALLRNTMIGRNDSRTIKIINNTY